MKKDYIEFQGFKMSPISEEEIGKDRNTSIIGLISIVSVLGASLFSNQIISGIVALIGLTSAIIWYIRRGYIFYSSNKKVSKK